MAYKVVSATYYREDRYKIPADWKMEDYGDKWGIKWGKVYKEDVDGPVDIQMTEGDLDEKRPCDVQDECEDWRDWFDEDEEDQRTTIESGSEDDEPIIQSTDQKKKLMAVSYEEREIILALRAKEGHFIKRRVKQDTTP